ncbi:hypothetical protein QF031_002166 [Pseudarthrobacter defluvii]|nr:hypothetical protein [Pseudarthrobacter defluvii]
MTILRLGSVAESRTSSVDGVITYSCACGFRFDQPTSSQHRNKDLP